MRRDTVYLSEGCLFEIGNQTYCLCQWVTSDSVIVRDVETLEERQLTLGQLTEELGAVQRAPEVDLSTLDERQWIGALEKYQLLKPLLEARERSRSSVSSVAGQLGVSTATAYRWLARLAECDTVTCLIRKSRSDKGKKKLDERVEALIAEVLQGEFLTLLKRSPTLTRREIVRRCRIAGYPVPSMTALLRRIEEIHPEEIERRRRGRNAALARRPIRGSFPGAEYVNAVWQIDHTEVDIVLVDERDRIPIGRPWITLVIDVSSRAVPGWYVSFDPPGALATGIAIANAILPKDELTARLGVNFAWPCQGKPRTIHSDNAKEFRGNMLKMACNEHGIDLQFRKVGKPNYGGHIERLLGTLLKEIHALEGSTFSNPREKGEYESERNAQMTLDEFERWLANLILGVYHNRLHSAIARAPLIRYKELLLGGGDFLGPGVLPIASDPTKIRIDFLPMVERTIQPSGVTIDHIDYHDPVVDRWIGARDTKNKRLARKFIFRRDPRNIAFTWFWDPDIKRYFKIPYRNIHRPAISLWELRAVKRFLAERTKNEIDEELIFDALNAMKRIEEESRVLTKKQRREQERQRRHARATAPKRGSVSRETTSVGNSNPAVARAEDELERLKNLTPFDEVEFDTGEGR